MARVKRKNIHYLNIRNSFILRFLIRRIVQKCKNEDCSFFYFKLISAYILSCISLVLVLPIIIQKYLYFSTLKTENNSIGVAVRWYRYTDIGKKVIFFPLKRIIIPTIYMILRLRNFSYTLWSSSEENFSLTFLATSIYRAKIPNKVRMLYHLSARFD